MLRRYYATIHLKVGDDMDLLLEIVFEIYLELMMHIVPEKEESSKKYRMIAFLIAIIVLLGVLALFIWGCVLIVDYENKLGLIPIIIAVIFSIIQIIAGFVLHDKKSIK